MKEKYPPAFIDRRTRKANGQKIKDSMPHEIDKIREAIDKRFETDFNRVFKEVASE